MNGYYPNKKLLPTSPKPQPLALQLRRLLTVVVWPPVSVHAKKTADRQIDNETNDRNKMKDYKREISLHAFS